MGYWDADWGMVSTHSRPKAAGCALSFIPPRVLVSTHSRPKAAGRHRDSYLMPKPCFNTQPPEGGWEGIKIRAGCFAGFNTQPPEGGWDSSNRSASANGGFNTQPPEGGWLYELEEGDKTLAVSTHSRPKAAGSLSVRHTTRTVVSTHSRPKAAGTVLCGLGSLNERFQHTAARRRLGRII